MLRYLFRKSPGYVLGYFLHGLLTALPNVVCNVLVYKLVIDAIAAKEGLPAIVWIVLLTAVFLVVSDCYNAYFSEIAMRKAKERLQNAMLKEVLAKAAEMDLASYDSKSFYDTVILAMDSSYAKAQETLECLVDIFSAAVNILFSLSVFLLVGEEVLVIIVLSILATFVWNRPIARLEKGKREAAVPDERRQSYLRRVFSLREYAKELRLSSGIPALLLRCYDRAVSGLTGTYQKWNRKKTACTFLQVFLSDNLLLQFVLTAYLLYSALVKKTITLGDFVAVFNGIHVTVSMVNYLIGSTFTRFKTNGLFIEKFRVFLSSKPSIRGGGLLQPPGDRKLSADHAGFTYPGNTAPTLESVSLSLCPGEKIALVGYNGAGKTTLIHLLLRLYDLSQGEICWGGKPVQQYDLPLYRGQFGVLFQNFQIYAATLAENIALDREWDRGKEQEAARRSGLAPLLQRLPLDLQTPVLREFNEDGLMLSGGEQQKLAIARIFYSFAPVLILDEPSSALDPLAEYELNRKIQSLSEDKTVLFISHRLSTVKMADKICLLDGGRIVEMGSHQQLLALKGSYWKLWNLQAEKYRHVPEASQPG